MSTRGATNRLNVLANHLSSLDAGNECKDDQISRQQTSSSLGFDKRFPQSTSAHLFPPAVFDALNLDGLLTSEERKLRDKTRQFMESQVAPVIADYWERAEFPHELLPKFAELKLAGGSITGYGCPGHNITAAAVAVAEVARVDASMSTFHLVHSYLAMVTIALLGSEDQRKELLPRMASCDLIGCWALTEPSNGSDASALQTHATRVPGGWVLDGAKRWIGNGTWADVVVVWARNSETGQVNAFIVRKGTPGFTATKMENKIALRCVQNADMKFERCFVPDSARLPGVDSFKDTNKVLAISRVMVAWQPVGIAMGVYDVVSRYVQERQQFGTPLAAFQLVQEKMMRMQGTIQAMYLMALRLARLHEEGRMTHEQASLVKSWTTLHGREVVALGRELMGGNGVLAHFHVAKAFCDLEAVYTYEGTYEVNVLVAGRGATGHAAFKASSKGAKK